MRYLLTSLLCVFTLSLTAQEPLTYPFNPDANGDTFVGVSDVLEGISTYDNFFFPSEIMVGDTTLSNWIQLLNQTLSNQQAVIDSLQASLASQDTQLDSTMIADMISAAGIGIAQTLSLNGDTLSISDGNSVILNTSNLIEDIYQFGYKTFNYTGAPQTLIVPPNTYTINIQCFAASGGNGDGMGGYISANYNCNPGDTLFVFVGGENGYNGGGISLSNIYTGFNGGGASDVRTISNDLNSRIIAAGGGSGSGNHGGSYVVSPYGAKGEQFEDWSYGENGEEMYGGLCSGDNWYAHGGGGGILSGGEACISELGIESTSQIQLNQWCVDCDYNVIEAIVILSGNGSLGTGGSGPHGGGGGWYGGGAGTSPFFNDSSSGGGSSYASSDLCSFPIDILGGINTGDGWIRISW